MESTWLLGGLPKVAYDLRRQRTTSLLPFYAGPWLSAGWRLWRRGGGRGRGLVWLAREQLRAKQRRQLGREPKACGGRAITSKQTGIAKLVRFSNGEARNLSSNGRTGRRAAVFPAEGKGGPGQRSKAQLVTLRPLALLAIYSPPSDRGYERMQQAPLGQCVRQHVGCTRCVCPRSRFLN